MPLNTKVRSAHLLTNHALFGEKRWLKTSKCDIPPTEDSGMSLVIVRGTSEKDINDFPFGPTPGSDLGRV